MTAWIRITGSIATLMAGTVPALAGPGNPSNGTFGHMMWGNGHGWWGGFGMLLFWGLIIAVAVFAVRALTDKRQGDMRDPIEILRERYARGEIDEDEFRRRKQELQS
jgi:putative membrane protein